jgi:monoamine oxidase
MRSVMDECGLSLAPMGMSYYVRDPYGVDTTHEAIAECASVVEAAAAEAGPGVSLAEVMTSVADQVEAHALAAFTSRFEVTSGCTVDRLGAPAAADSTLAFEAKPSYRVDGGNQRVALELARRLGDSVRLREVVQRVVWGEDYVRVVTDSAEIEGDCAVVATPMAVTRELEFDPPMPRWKVDAWSRAGLGHTAKLHVPLLRGTELPRWSAVQNVPERFWTWTATDGSGQVQPIVHCFSGSGPALGALQVEAGPRTWAARVAEVRDDLALDLEGAVVTTWSDEPYSREAYTAMTTDWRPEDDQMVEQPVGAVHFAGEHTAGDWAGLMEGALRSGVRAANEVVARP